MAIGKLERNRVALHLHIGKDVSLMLITNELDSMCGISDEELTRRFKESIRIDDEVRKIKGLPVARSVMVATVCQRIRSSFLRIIQMYLRM